MLRPMLFLLLSLLLLLSGCKVEMYSGLSEDQANQMLSTLLRRGIEAEKQAAGKNGYTLLVDDDQLVRALQVLKENSLPREAFKGLLARVRFHRGSFTAKASLLARFPPGIHDQAVFLFQLPTQLVTLEVVAPRLHPRQFLRVDQIVCDMHVDVLGIDVHAAMALML